MATGNGKRRRQLTGLNGGYWSSPENVEKRRRHEKRQHDSTTDQKDDEVKR
jgi:hypothetical protein